MRISNPSQVEVEFGTNPPVVTLLSSLAWETDQRVEIGTQYALNALLHRLIGISQRSILRNLRVLESPREMFSQKAVSTLRNIMKSLLLVGMLCCASYSFRISSVLRHPSGRLLCNLKSLKSKSLLYSSVNNVSIMLHLSGSHHYQNLVTSSSHSCSVRSQPLHLD